MNTREISRASSPRTGSACWKPISRRIPIEYLCESIPEWNAHVEKVETARGFGSHHFWNELRVALSLDSIVGCCPPMPPSSFPYASWTGVSPDWGSQQRLSCPIFSLLCASTELQQSLSSRQRPDEVWFALSRRSTLDRHVKQLLERAGQVIDYLIQTGFQGRCEQGEL